jgi:metal-responsive CopG/Arc/MetJ family transcriptional regulator
MARFTIEIPDDLHKEFRIRVIEVYGTERGAITKAIVEAIRVWLKQKQPPQSRKYGRP